MVKSQKVIFSKIAENAHRASSTEAAYSFNFNSGLRTRRTCFCLLRTPSPRGEQFL